MLRSGQGGYVWSMERSVCSIVQCAVCSCSVKFFVFSVQCAVTAVWHWCELCVPALIRLGLMCSVQYMQCAIYAVGSVHCAVTSVCQH